MTKFLEELAARRRFGMRPGLETIGRLLERLGSPQARVPAIHVAGTNGKGAVTAIVDAALRSAGYRIGRYTSPHLVRLNERFFLDGAALDDGRLEEASRQVANAANGLEITFFEALTAVAFLAYGEVAKAEDRFLAVLETGLGGRLDATNVCRPRLCIITRIGLDHCDWLGDTVEKIAAEKAGIIKPGVPVVLGENVPEVIEVVRRRAAELQSPFVYAPEIATAAELPKDFSLAGAFNRENAVTATAALKTLLGIEALTPELRDGFSKVIWPGRFQRLGHVLVDGAHNPPAARALARALAEDYPGEKFVLIAGFCADKDVDETLRTLRPHVARAIAVPTVNPRALAPEELAVKMRAAGMESEAMTSLAAALAHTSDLPQVLVAGSLFLAGEALVLLKAHQSSSIDPSEVLVTQQ